MPYSKLRSLPALGLLGLILALQFFLVASPAQAVIPGCQTYPKDRPDIPPQKECCWRDANYPKADAQKDRVNIANNDQCLPGNPIELSGQACWCGPLKGGAQTNTTPTTTPGTTNTKKNNSDPIVFRPGVSIPNSDYTVDKEVKIENSTDAIIKYIVAIVKYSTGVIGIIAAIAMMLGGITWLTAAGNQEKIGSAKKMIGSSLAGLCLAFLSFFVLSMVNTNLVEFKSRALTPVTYESTDKACVLKIDKGGKKTSQNLSKEECAKIQKEVPGNGFASVECKLYSNGGWSAIDNDCVQTNGCCLMDIGQKIFILQHYPVDKICVQAMTQSACESWQSSNWSFLDPVTVKPNIKITYGFGKRCQAVDWCKDKKICTTPKCEHEVPR